MTRHQTKKEWGLVYLGALTGFRAVTRAQCRQLRKFCEDGGSPPVRKFQIARVVETTVWTVEK